MRRQWGLVGVAALMLAAVVVGAEAVLAEQISLVTIVDATPGHCSVRTTAPSCFSPSLTTVTVGGTVEWYNRSNLQHTVTGSGWGSGTIGSNGTYRHRFDTVGDWAYHCSIHPTMTGTVHVYDPNATTSTDSQSSGSPTSFSISSPQNQPFTSTTTTSSTTTSTGATSATRTDTTDSGDVALAGGDSGSDTVTFSSGSHSSAPAAVVQGGGSGLSAVVVLVLLLLLIGGGSAAALVVTRPGRAARP